MVSKLHFKMSDVWKPNITRMIFRSILLKVIQTIMFTSYVIDIITMYYSVMSKSVDACVTFTKETKCQNKNFWMKMKITWPMSAKKLSDARNYIS